MGSDKNNPKMDSSFLWSQGIHLILDQKSNLGFSQRNAPLHKAHIDTSYIYFF